VLESYTVDSILVLTSKVLQGAREERGWEEKARDPVAVGMPVCDPTVKEEDESDRSMKGV
jgi:hypothetical protein